MASLYPGGLDELNAGVGGASDPLSAPSHPAHHTALADAVEAIEGELGTDPSGGSATVKARLDTLDTTVSGKAAASHSHAESDVTGLVADLAGKVPASTVDAKGDLLVATADNTVARLGVGTNGHVLTADSAQSTGLKWAAASGSGDPTMGGDLSGLASNAQIVAGAVTDVEVAAGNKDGAAGTASMRTLGTGASQAAAGNHNHSGVYEPADSDLTAVAGLSSTGLIERTGAGTAATRTIGVAGANDIPSRSAADGRYVQQSLVDAKGDVVTATADNTPARVAVGTDGQVLTADSGQSTGLKWSTPAAETLPASTVDAKGDLLVATADNTVARLGVGTNGHVLTADSAQSSGVKWAAAAGGGSAPPAPSPYIVRSGHYYPNNMGAVSLSTYSVAADQVFYVPILFSESAAVTQIGLFLTDVGVAGGGSATGCLGIYSNSASNQPSSLIVSAGTMDLTATPGGRFLTISQTLAANTLYWLAFAHGLTGTNPKMRGPTYAAQQGATLLGAHNLDSFNNSMAGQWHRATFGWVEARTYDGTVPASVGTLTALRLYDVNFPVVSVKL